MKNITGGRREMSRVRVDGASRQAQRFTDSTCPESIPGAGTDGLGALTRGGRPLRTLTGFSDAAGTTGLEKAWMGEAPSWKVLSALPGLFSLTSPPRRLQRSSNCVSQTQVLSQKSSSKYKPGRSNRQPSIVRAT